MTLTINLEPDVEAGILAQAEAQGAGCSGYVGNLVRAGLGAAG